MSSWLTEQDFRDLRGEATAWPGLTLNVAFLQDIKQDTEKPDEIIHDIKALLADGLSIDPAQLANQLSRLRDELETYSAKLIQPQVSTRAETLQSQHEQIYLDVCELIELAECALYREKSLEKALPAIIAGFHSFVENFNCHEQEEFDLMMQLCNQDIGVGD